MKREDVVLFIREYLKERGFERKGVRWYKRGEGFLCHLYLQKSYYGDIYYINYDFFLGECKTPYPRYLDDGEVAVGGRFALTEGDSCRYNIHTMRVFAPLFDKNYVERIQPIFEVGTHYILEHYVEYYFSPWATYDTVKQCLEKHAHTDSNE